ncbi:MAG: hypothetical protein LBC87_02825 [Fibromonadaceae bacterium]|jgi:hypothetical protein|nr:hypothetical protein [Fibromonadaceae bacterium]
MNKTKILAFIALAAILSACGSDDGGSPPKLAKEYIKNISPFDTLVVKFNSNLVDLDTSGKSNVVLGNGEKWVNCYDKNKKPKPRSSGKELCFIGANTTPGSLNYFDKEGSIVFVKIKNSDGYINDKTVFDFTTLDLLDREPNNSQTSASELDREKATRDTVKFAGVLDHKATVNEETIYDVEDYYMLKLKGQDIVSINVTNRDALKLIIKGPNSRVKDTTFQIPKGGNPKPLTYEVGLEYLLENPTSDPVPFYINVTDDAPTSPPNPYTINIKVNAAK